MDTMFESVDNSASLEEQVRAAIERSQPLQIRGGNSKAFVGRPVSGEVIDTRVHRGIVRYDPTELVVTVRAGTSLTELEETLEAAGQMLPSEAPVFGGNSTVGGMVASGLSGPRRPWGGAVRDFVLGCRIVTGTGKHLRFGGEVMKNVAGYDVSRLIAGSFGALGLITEASLKVLPKPRATLSLAQTMSAEAAISKISKWRSEGVPVTGACHIQDTLYVRIEGGDGSVKAARELVGGEETSYEFWIALREFQLPFFSDSRPLWRLSLPASAPHINLPGTVMTDWGGSQRWLKSYESQEIIREIAQRHGGHASCYTPGVTDQPFHPLPGSLMKLHQRLKEELDPRAIFNPGRMYADI
jgi:glycolate oxidase FAD binding subunit